MSSVSRLISAVVVFLIVLAGDSQASSEILLRPLFEERSMVVGSLIPFSFDGANGSPSYTIVGVRAESSQSKNCRAALDPYNPAIVLLRCHHTDPVILRFVARSSTGALREFRYGPLRMRKPDGEAIDGDSGGTQNPQIAEGLAIFNGNNCIDCHDVRSDPRVRGGKTVAQIAAALQREPMKGRYPNGFSSSDVEKMAAYLGSVK